MKSITGTDVGLVRTSNQDRCFASDQPVGTFPNLFLLADGMGGHLAGEYASTFTIEEFIRLLEATPSDPDSAIQHRLAAIAMEVNETLYKESQTPGDHYGTGTTLVAAVVDQDVLYAINIGDSRLYRVTDQIEQVSLDHSYAEEMVRQGLIARDSEEYLNNKHIITRALGPWSNLRVDRFALPLRNRECILLCSDGLSNMVSDKEILDIIHRNLDFSDVTSLDRIRDQLLDSAREHGGTDNITFVLAVPDFE